MYKIRVVTNNDELMYILIMINIQFVCLFLSYLVLRKCNLHVIIKSMVEHINRVAPQFGDTTWAHSVYRTPYSQPW